MYPVKPIVSVLMSAYNAEKYLSLAIQSVLEQTFSDFEFLIIDDCSTDSTISIINSFSDDRIKVIRNEVNLGLTKSLNKGLKLAKGKYIARMDADDISLPQRFQKQVAFLDKNEHVVLLGTAFENFGNFNKTTIYDSAHDKIRWKQLYECHILHPSVMMRNSFLLAHNLKYDECFAQAQDYDFWARISQVGCIANLPDVLVKYRQCDENISHRLRENQFKGIIKVNKFLFDKLGVKDVSDEDLKVFKNTVYQQYQSDLICLEQLLMKILTANKSSDYFPTIFIKDKLYYMWYHACYNNLKVNSKAIKIFFSSPLSKLNKDVVGKARFYVKSFVS